ncbi:hypothetical protein ADUPG1_012912, partial [Aduncisulcus paluster]
LPQDGLASPLSDQPTPVKNSTATPSYSTHGTSSSLSSPSPRRVASSPPPLVIRLNTSIMTYGYGSNGLLDFCLGVYTCGCVREALTKWVPRVEAWIEQVQQMKDEEARLEAEHKLEQKSMSYVPSSLDNPIESIKKEAVSVDKAPSSKSKDESEDSQTKKKQIIEYPIDKLKIIQQTLSKIIAKHNPVKELAEKHMKQLMKKHKEDRLTRSTLNNTLLMLKKVTDQLTGNANSSTNVKSASLGRPSASSMGGSGSVLPSSMSLSLNLCLSVLNSAVAWSYSGNVQLVKKVLSFLLPIAARKHSPLFLRETVCRLAVALSSKGFFLCNTDVITVMNARCKDIVTICGTFMCTLDLGQVIRLKSKKECEDIEKKRKKQQEKEHQYLQKKEKTQDKNKESTPTPEMEDKGDKDPSMSSSKADSPKVPVVFSLGVVVSSLTHRCRFIPAIVIDRETLNDSISATAASQAINKTSQTASVSGSSNLFDHCEEFTCPSTSSLQSHLIKLRVSLSAHNAGPVCILWVAKNESDGSFVSLSHFPQHHPSQSHTHRGLHTLGHIVSFTPNLKSMSVLPHPWSKAERDRREQKQAQRKKRLPSAISPSLSSSSVFYSTFRTLLSKPISYSFPHVILPHVFSQREKETEWEREREGMFAEESTLPYASAVPMSRHSLMITDNHPQSYLPTSRKSKKGISGGIRRSSLSRATTNSPSPPRNSSGSPRRSSPSPKPVFHDQSSSLGSSRDGSQISSHSDTSTGSTKASFGPFFRKEQNTSRISPSSLVKSLDHLRTMAAAARKEGVGLIYGVDIFFPTHPRAKSNPFIEQQLMKMSKEVKVRRLKQKKDGVGKKAELDSESVLIRSHVPIVSTEPYLSFIPDFANILSWDGIVDDMCHIVFSLGACGVMLQRPLAAYTCAVDVVGRSSSSLQQRNLFMKSHCREMGSSFGTESVLSESAATRCYSGVGGFFCDDEISDSDIPLPNEPEDSFLGQIDSPGILNDFVSNQGLGCAGARYLGMTFDNSAHLHINTGTSSRGSTIVSVTSSSSASSASSAGSSSSSTCFQSPFSLSPHLSVSMTPSSSSVSSGTPSASISTLSSQSCQLGCASPSTSSLTLSLLTLNPLLFYFTSSVLSR